MQPTFSSNPHTHFSGKNCGTTFGNGQAAAQPHVAPAPQFVGEVAFGKKQSVPTFTNKDGDSVMFSGCCH